MKAWLIWQEEVFSHGDVSDVTEVEGSREEIFQKIKSEIASDAKKQRCKGPDVRKRFLVNIVFLPSGNAHSGCQCKGGL